MLWLAGAPKFSKGGPTTARWDKRPICPRRMVREKGRWSKTTLVVTAHGSSPDISRRRSVPTIGSYASSLRVTRTWPATRTGLVGVYDEQHEGTQICVPLSTRFGIRLQRVIGKLGSGGHYDGNRLAGAIPRGTSAAARTQPEDNQRISPLLSASCHLPLHVPTMTRSNSL
jgi:hypothetical protein